MPTLPPETPGWLVLFVAIAIGLKYLAQFLSEANESFSKLLGPLGRRWRERGLERMRERAETSSFQLTAIADDRDFFKQRAADLEAERRDLVGWYTQCDQPFHRELAIKAAEAGCELPPWTPLSQWRDPTIE